MATIVDEIIGFLVVGLIAAAFVKPAAAMQGATAQAA
jgi:hypothetical protein